MSDTNIDIQWNGLQDAMGDMQTLTTRMDSAFSDLLAGIAQLQQTAEGNAATAWKELQHRINLGVQQMDGAFRGGHVSLTNMAQTQQDGDNNGAKIMQH